MPRTLDPEVGGSSPTRRLARELFAVVTDHPIFLNEDGKHYKRVLEGVEVGIIMWSYWWRKPKNPREPLTVDERNLSCHMLITGFEYRPKR